MPLACLVLALVGCTGVAVQGQNLGLTVIQTPAPGLGTGAGSDVAERPSGQTATPDLAPSASLPLITGLVPDNGGSGASVKVLGANFGAASELPFKVSIGGVLVADAVRVSDSEIRLKVPEAAGSGDLVVRVGEIGSNGKSFRILSSLSVLPALNHLLVGRSATYSVRASDAAGAPVAEPALDWSVSGNSVRLEGGRVIATAPGVALLEARSGSVRATGSVVVLGGEVRSVYIWPPSTRMGRLADDRVRFAAVNVMSDGSTNSLVTYESLEPASVSVDALGQGLVLDFVNGGTVSVAATSILDPAKHGRATVMLSQGVWVETIAGSGQSGFADGMARAARFGRPAGVAVRERAIYVADRGARRIRAIDADGTVTTVAGKETEAGGPSSDGPFPESTFRDPCGIAVNPQDGDVYLAEETNGQIRMLSQALSMVFTVTGFGAPGGRPQDGPVETAKLQFPCGIVLDRSGVVYLAEPGAIRKIASEVVSTVAGGTTQGFADGSGNAARFDNPLGIAVDMAGNVYVADTENHAIRRVDSSGRVSTIAGAGSPGKVDGPAAQARFKRPTAIAAGPDGSLYIVDSGNNQIRVLTPLGAVRTLAGTGGTGFQDGPGASATFSLATALEGGIGLSADGSLIVSDTYNYSVRRLRFF